MENFARGARELRVVRLTEQSALMPSAVLPHLDAILGLARHHRKTVDVRLREAFIRLDQHLNATNRWLLDNSIL